jgi:hypothetical protein
LYFFNTYLNIYVTYLKKYFTCKFFIFFLTKFFFFFNFLSAPLFFFGLRQLCKWDPLLVQIWKRVMSLAIFIGGDRKEIQQGWVVGMQLVGNDFYTQVMWWCGHGMAWHGEERELAFGLSTYPLNASKVKTIQRQAGPPNSFGFH